ncbi:MAG: hypothetical protein IJS12_02820 [Lachnospiraceae bacterium]|nr:hypothetical protein [Lachnospiraceae bacterium]
MKTEIYTLTKDDIKPLLKDLPAKVAENMDREGYYTLGAVDAVSDSSDIRGVVQFLVDQTVNKEVYARLIYVYVPEEYRRRSVGMRLVGKADSILASAGDVDVFLAGTGTGVAASPQPELSEEEQRMFLTECGFISLGDDGKQFFRFTGR